MAVKPLFKANRTAYMAPSISPETFRCFRESGLSPLPYSVSTNAEGAVGYVKEGYAFSPMFTLGYNSKIKDKEVVATWLKLEKAN